MIGEFGVGPIGPVQPLPSGPVDDPATDRAGHLGRDSGVGPLGLAGPEPGEAGFQVAVEPPLDRAWSEAQVGGDVLMRPAPVGQADDLEAVPEPPVGRLAERLLEFLDVEFGELDADHDDEGYRVQKGPTFYTNQTASSGV